MTTDDIDARPLRILLVTDKVPGHDNGYAIRVANVIDGLRAAGDLHVCLVDSSRFGEQLREGAGYTTSRLRIENPPAWEKGVRLQQLLPANVRYHAAAAGRATLAADIGRAPWDVVWCSRMRVHLLTDGVAIGPRIVDLDDLTDRLLRSKIVDRTARHGSLATFPLNARDWLDARLWGRLHRRVARTVDRVVVCSEADRDHLGIDNCAVVPNGYPVPPSRRSSQRPLGNRMLLVGPLTYEPNRLAAEWMIKAVLPTIRTVVPDAELLLVGEVTDGLRRHLAAPGVTLAGQVPDVAPYYDRVSIAVVPLHSGGGTRIKVIEALARSVPIVSTSFGQIGHHLEPGRHLLVADDAMSFAEACVSLLADPDRRDEIARRGHRAYLSGLTSRATSAAVTDLTREVAGRPPATGDPDEPERTRRSR